MPLRDWLVVLSDDQKESVFYNVRAFTEDGAINRALKEYEERYGVMPHEEQILKVESNAPTATA